MIGNFHRRTRKAVSVATVVLTAAGALTGCGGPEDTAITAPETDTDRPPKLHCPESPEAPGRPTSGGAPKLVERGAVVARLCPVETRASRDLPPPEDELTEQTLRTGVGTLVKKLNSLPDAAPGGFCLEDLGPTYLFLLGYPDGRKATVTFETFGCGIVRAGDNFSFGGRDLRQTYARLLEAQTTSQSPTPG